jgi:hypothetical protein
MARSTAMSRGWLWLATIPVLTLGGLEGWYGKTVAGDVYGSDAVQYLDIARAFERGDAHSALNPLWSDGYPALLALLRPAFRAGLDGEWNAVRWLNFAIFVLSWLGFVAFVRELLRGREGTVVTWFGAVCLFVTAQVCLDQVSRVGPDQLVAALFFMVCALLLKLQRRPSPGLAALLGLLLGVGFLVKSIFLPLGCAAIAIAAVGLFRARRKLLPIWPAAIFALIVLGYGVGLSRATGTPTLGEAGALNYAWHVNRLAKWVHWEGGVDPADKAWPKPWIARFAQWQSQPPDFGRPIHSGAVTGSAPTVYSFHAPVEATYVPYFDPPYFYQGYRHILNWRYQVVALGKNLVDLVHILAEQPMIWALALAFLVLLRRRDDRAALWSSVPGWLREVWPAWALAAAGIAIYLPVHLEARYIAAFIAVICVVKLDGFSSVLERSGARRAIVIALLGVGFAAGLVKDQREVWQRALHHWSYRDNIEWREAQALRAEGFAPGSEVGVISWTPNLQCDWAYLADVRITSEIASPADEKAFWALSWPEQVAVLGRFRQAGADAVITRDKPPDGAAGWAQVGGVPMWLYRF